MEGRLKMNKTFSGFILFSILAIGLVTYAQAQIDPEFKGVPSDCQVFEGTQQIPGGNKTTKMLNCKWIIEDIQLDDLITVEQDLTDEEKEVIDDAKECRDDPECEDPTVTPPPKDPDYDKDGIIDQDDKLKEQRDSACQQAERFPDDLKKQDLCNSLDQATQCEQGINESQPVQENRFFLTTDFVMSIWRHWNYDTEYVLGVLTAANLECHYQRTILEPLILGPQYKDIQEANVVDAVPNHRDRATQKVGIQQPRLTTAAFANSLDVAFDALCDSTHIDRLTKADYGCPTRTYDIIYQANLRKDPNYREWENPNPSWNYTTSEAWQNAEEYKVNPKIAMPLGATEKFIVITPQQGIWAFKVNTDD